MLVYRDLFIALPWLCEDRAMSPAQLEKLKPAGNMFLQVLGLTKIYKVSVQHPALKNGGLVHISCLQPNVQTHPWTLKTSLQSNEEEHLQDISHFQSLESVLLTHFGSTTCRVLHCHVLRMG